MLPAELAQSFDQAAGEYRDSMLANTFMPQSTLGLAEFETKLGNMAAAASLYEHAMKTGSDFGMVQHAYVSSKRTSTRTSAGWPISLSPKTPALPMFMAWRSIHWGIPIRP